LPVDPHEHEIIARTDSAALTHGFIDACRARGVRFAVGHDLTAPIRTACLSVPNSWWVPAITADGVDEREDAEVAEITDLIDLSRWPDGTRAIARREDPHPGAQLTFTDFEGRRYQVFITDLDDPDIAYLEALHRGRGRAEKRICDAKDTGENLPSAHFAINSAWVQLVLVAQDLLAWTKLLCLNGELARAEPKRLRYTLFHAAGIIVRSGRRNQLRIAAGWPWANQLVNAFTRARALAPT
jgi:Transposase DDE domain group 1